MDLRQTTEEILKRIAESHQAPLNDVERAGLTQSGTATTGLTFYDLEPAAKLLYPVLTPLRNRIPRVSGKGGIQANWKAITGINTANMRGVVSEGNRGGAITHTLTEYLAAYRGVGLENYVTFEAELAAQGFDDAKALAVQMLLQSTMLEEEILLLGGNTSTSIGACATPTVSDVATGGTLAYNTTYKVYVVPLTLEGYLYNNVADGLASTVTKTNTDASTDTIYGGVGEKCTTAGSVTTANDSNNTHCINASVTAVKGAVAYAWYWGVSGSELLGAITTINSYVITAAATGTQNASAISASTDYSANSMAFDGLLYQCFKSGSGSYYVALATGTIGTGTALTSDGAGGITQFETAFQSFWDNYRLSPDIIYVSAKELLAINKLVIGNSGTSALIRFNTDVTGQTINAGVVIGTYLNKITNKQVSIVVHPKMPAGTILFYSDGVPYPLAGVQNIVQVRARRDYYQIEWPLRTRKYEYGVYADEVLQNYFPPAFGVITNIGG